MLPLYSIKGIFSSGISLKQFALVTEGTQGAPLAFVSKANPKRFTYETIGKAVAFYERDYMNVKHQGRSVPAVPLVLAGSNRKKEKKNGDSSKQLHNQFRVKHFPAKTV